MKKIATVLLLIIPVISIRAQNTRVVDSPKKIGVTVRSDSNRKGIVHLTTDDGRNYDWLDTGQELQQIVHFPKGKTILFLNPGKYPQVLSSSLAVLKDNAKRGNFSNLSSNFAKIGNIYSNRGDHRQAIKSFFMAKAIAESLHNYSATVVNLTNLANQYSTLAMPDSALIYAQLAYRLALKRNDTSQLIVTTRLLGWLFSSTHRTGFALSYFRKSLSYSKHNDENSNTSETVLKMAKLFEGSGRSDSSLHYARQSIAISLQGHMANHVIAASKFLTDYFKDHSHLDSAFRYQQITLVAKDSLFNQEKVKHAMQLSFAERERKRDLIRQGEADEAAIRLYVMFVVVGIFLLLAIIFWRNNRKNKKAKKLLQQQKHQIEIALSELKITQDQLIHSAKMASLGELTAGIAHEIQNPLNFVNNFSEVSVELLQELKEEAEAGHTADVIAITSDLAQNLQKINYHGKRADSIVKSMLQHSRTCSGERAPANINAITDEFFKLAYHGLRAKDKSFIAELTEHFDESLPKASIVQQDIGRVLANIFNNAFYAIHHKQKNAGAGYKPAVTVTTSWQNGQVAVKIKDNGDGIADNIRDKIMQPFFTTKPAGEGTGLGLSLSYDIVVKGHGGSISVDTKPGEFTEFVVRLPV